MILKADQKNGDQLSILGFGCMRLPTKGVGIDEDQSIKMIRNAIDNGVNYFDTAYFYHNGKSESLLGDALVGGYREKVKIATKLPPFLISNLGGGKKIFATQIARLKTNYIDYYLLHMLTDKATFDRMADLGIMEWLEELKRKRIIHNIGFSFHGNKMDFEQIIQAYPWDICQIQYNYLDENNQATKSGLQLANFLGIPVVIMEPLRGGKLVNNLPTEAIKEFESYYEKRTPAEWALRWLWNQPEINVVLSGMSDETQLEENIKIASKAEPNSLSTEELRIFESVKAILHEKTKIPCTSCGYCMPCPYGVDIPGCFSSYNDKYLLGLRQNRWHYMQTLGVLSKQPAYASICKECRKCEESCPQKIQIRQQLKIIRKEMELPFFKTIVKIVRKATKIE